MSQKFRLIKLLERPPFTVWQVDGPAVRRELNGQFTNFGQHFRFPFIPTYEFWLDIEAAPAETNFFIDHLLAEWRYMKRGEPYAAALERADRLERAERRKSKFGQRLNRLSPAARLKTIHEHRLSVFSSANLQVWIVNGEAIRDTYHLDFTEGGHDYVYDFVPAGEVWLDDDLSPRERHLILLHELHERALMAAGADYPSAHASASRLESACRHRPWRLPSALWRARRQNRRLPPKNN